MYKFKKVIRHFPNVITLMNLVSGSISIVASFEGKFEIAGLLIILAGIFDFFDGFTARLIGAYTQLGKELDSLSDVVSFGVAPSIILYHLMRQRLGLSGFHGVFDGHIILLIPFVVAAFSSLRLGLFNIDERQTSSFIGLPTPANAFLIVGLVFGIHSNWAELFIWLTNSTLKLTVISIILSFLLVCELPMFSLKIKSLKPSIAYKQFTFLAGIIVLLLIFQKAALSLIIVWYLVLSLIYFGYERLVAKQ